MNLLTAQFFGMKVVVEDSVTAVKRSWKERLFTRPWRPFVKVNYVPQLANGEAYKFGNTIVMNSWTRNALLEQVSKSEAELSELMKANGIN
jgi:hypothetical protein